jgi:hypothetical protein
MIPLIARCCSCEHVGVTLLPVRQLLHGQPMTSYSGYMFRDRSWLRPLQALAMTLLLLVFPLDAGRANAAVSASGAPSAHVYLLRGVLNIFSLGLDEIAAKLRQQGIPVTVVNYLSWSSLADEAAAEYRSGRVRTIVLVGHSSGATVLPAMVERLDQLGAPVKLAIGLDSVFRTSLSGHVGRYINFYIANGAGTPVAKTSQFHGALENVDVQAVPGVGHITIEKNQIIQQRVISAIDAVVFNRRMEASTVSRKLQPEASVTKQNPVTAGAAASARN